MTATSKYISGKATVFLPGPRTRQKLHARTVVKIGKKAEVDAAHSSRSKLRYAQVMQSKNVGKWVPVLSHQIYHLIARPPSRKE